MAKKPSSQESSPAKARLEEAAQRLKAATAKHEALVAILSRPGASAQDRRLAQAQGKKIESELREAARLFEEAQAGA
jgi:hypothetical protein